MATAAPLFTARRYASAAYAMALRLSVRLSVRPSQVGALSAKHVITETTPYDSRYFLMPKILIKCRLGHSQRGRLLRLLKFAYNIVALRSFKFSLFNTKLRMHHNTTSKEQVVKSNLTYGRIAAAHGRFSRIRQWRQCAPHLIMLPSANPSPQPQTASRSVQPFLQSSRS